MPCPALDRERTKDGYDLCWHLCCFLCSCGQRWNSVYGVGQGSPHVTGQPMATIDDQTRVVQVPGHPVLSVTCRQLSSRDENIT
jgi:hypothetical protein